MYSLRPHVLTLSQSHPVPANQTDNFPTYAITVNDVSTVPLLMRTLYSPPRLLDQPHLGVLRPGSQHCR